MLKLLLTGFWVCIVTLGAVWFSISQATAPVHDANAAPKIETEILKGESVSIPLIGEGGVQGYFISRVSFIVDKSKMKQAKLPMTELMTDTLYGLLVGNPVVDLQHTDRFDLAAYKASIKQHVNGQFGDDVVSEVLVEQLDYLSKEDIRGNSNAQRQVRSGVKITPGEAVPAAAGSAPASH